jgi:hypothetical protein
VSVLPPSASVRLLVVCKTDGTPGSIFGCVRDEFPKTDVGPRVFLCPESLHSLF